MKYRLLGKTKLGVSEIGFGAWGIGGLSAGATSYGPADDQESVKALQTAYELGINFYDTSNVYGDGHSEELIGATFQKVRARVLIATKCGFSAHNSPQDFSPANIRNSLEGSLRRLRTDYIDLLQLHSAPIELLQKDQTAVETLRNLQSEGKIRAFGISTRSPEDGLIAASLGFESIQVNFSMLDQRANHCHLTDMASKEKIGLIARTPLCFGFLSKNPREHYLQFDPRDHRSLWSLEQLKRWAEAADLFSQLNKGKNRTLPQLALKFCLSFSSISTVIPGMMKVSEVVANAAASEQDDLRPEELESIRLLASQNQFFLGKT